MRISVENVKLREAFVSNLVKETPTITVRGIQEKFKEKFGNQMRPGRVLELRNLALNTTEVVVTDNIAVNPEAVVVQ